MKAIILFSGGLDSTVMLALALKQGLDCLALSFDYNQRHKIELQSAAILCDHYGVPHHTIKIDPAAFRHSALVCDRDVVKNRSIAQIGTEGIPSTYVPARNTIFLSFALAQAEILNAGEIHVGMNASDRHCYVDCRPEFALAFQNLINVATKQSSEGGAPQLITPLLELDKVQIVKLAQELGVPIEKTHSCYSPMDNGKACEECDACIIRADAIKQGLQSEYPNHLF